MPWRWTKTAPPTEEMPVSFTVAAMDQTGVSRALFLAGNTRRVYSLDA